jgi:signal transduction histidine kinase
MKEKKGKSEILPVVPVSTDGGMNIEMQTVEGVLSVLKTLTKEVSERKTEKLKLEELLSEQTKELEAVNRELVFQNEEKVKRAAELAIANKELAFQNATKEKLADELIIANIELVHQNKEKEKRAAELVIANKELAFQNATKEKLADELIIANIELVHQNKEKEKRAAELIIANSELAFQNTEKEKRAAELIIANIELVHQNEEKEKRAAELIIANSELAFQNTEKEKRAAELLFANNELRVFTYISSHDLQEPLRKIQVFSSLILEKERALLSDNGRDYLNRTLGAAQQMRVLIEALQVYSHSSLADQTFSNTSLTRILEKVKKKLAETILEKKAVIECGELPEAMVNPFQFHLVISHLLGNALKFSRKETAPHITVSARVETGALLLKENPGLDTGTLSVDKKYYHLSFTDNGIGFDVKYKDKMFQIFQRLNPKELYPGSGIGLPIVKKIIENHNGFITATGEIEKFARFDIYIPSH